MAYIAAGFREDCTKLIAKFVTQNDLNFQGFSAVWNEMHFSSTLRNRISFLETYEFLEEALFTPKDFLKSGRRYEEKLGALYLLYSIFFKKTVQGPKIRMLMSEWKEFMLFKLDLIKLRNYEALLILKKLFDSNAFVHCFPESERGLENYYVIREFLKDNPKLEIENKKEKIKFLDMMNDISKESQNYFQLKKQLAGQVDTPTLFNEEKLNDMLDDVQNLDENPPVKETEKVFLKQEVLDEYSDSDENEQQSDEDRSNSSASEYVESPHSDQNDSD